MVGLERTIVGLDFRYDPDLKIVKVTCRWIPCAYLTYLEILKLPWDVNNGAHDQPKYGVNKMCIY